MYTDSDPGRMETEVHDWRDERRERREARMRDPLRGLFWGMFLVLVGVIGLLELSSGVSDTAVQVCGLAGLGGIFIIDALVRHARQRYNLLGARLAIGSALAVIALLVALGVSQWWPVVLIGAGVAVLLNIYARNSEPAPGTK